jgi:hypothetical protein
MKKGISFKEENAGSKKVGKRGQAILLAPSQLFYMLSIL